ncbi:hypothetical protein V1505DRAFT_216987 [Lipomyces doorenjongii]
MIRQVETNSRLVQHWVAREDLVASVRQQAIEINRDATRSNRSGSEVTFVDGSIPSSKGLPPLTHAADIDSLTLEQARELAIGHGIHAARMSEEENKRSPEGSLGLQRLATFMVTCVAGRSCFCALCVALVWLHCILLISLPKQEYLLNQSTDITSARK